MAYPLSEVYITQSFGGNASLYAQWGLAGHHGVDLRAYYKRFSSPYNGVVTVTAENGYRDPLTGKFASGKIVVVRSATYDWWFLHLSQIDVKVGQKVVAGERLGITGNTGASLGAHLHMGCRPIKNPNMSNGYRGFINPITVIKNNTGTSQPPVIVTPPKGDNDMADAADVKAIYELGPLERTADSAGVKNYTGRKTDLILKEHAGSAEYKRKVAAEARAEKAQVSMIINLKDTVAGLGKRPTIEQYEQAMTDLKTTGAELNEAQIALEEARNIPAVEVEVEVIKEVEPAWTKLVPSWLINAIKSIFKKEK